MYLLEAFEPHHVLRHFENICAIPHPSKHEEGVRAYVRDFAEKHGHSWRQDEKGNLLVNVAATPGYENVPPVLLQAHMDMVPAKVEGSDHNFETDPLKLRIVDGHKLYATGTTLGADNAVGEMNMLALMEDDTVIHPPLELLFTVEEEIGMLGIRAMDFSWIKSRRMINMDCGDPDVMCVMSAGSATCLTKLPVQREAIQGTPLELNVTGLLGGHSGLRIDEGRASAFQLSGRILSYLSEIVPVRVVDVKAPRFSGIANSMKTVVAVADCDVAVAQAKVQELYANLQMEYGSVEKNMVITIETTSKAYTEMLCAECSERLVDLLYLLPYGVTERDWQEKETILCSVNCVEVILGEKEATLESMLRAPSDNLKMDLVHKMQHLAKLCGANLIVTDAYDGWPWRKDSPMQRSCQRLFEEMYHRPLTLEKANSCAETGPIAGAIPDMDIVAMAPLGRGAHTPEEYMDLDTVLPFWNFLTNLLATMCKE